MPIPPLRAAVIAILEAAGFLNREDHLPVKSSGGTFAVVGNIGVTVYAEWWSGDERALLVRMAAALRDAGLEVEDRGDPAGSAVRRWPPASEPAAAGSLSLPPPISGFGREA